MTLAAAVVFAWAAAGGCGSKDEFDAVASHTPESLAQELAFRYKALSPSARVAKKRRDVPSKKKGDPSKSHDEQSAVKAQTKEATKKALATNIDDVLDEIGEKASKITSQPRDKVFDQIADALSKDSSVEAADRETLAGKLREMGKN